ncbi:TPA: hypothetical protein ACHOYU_005079 [Raoultella planticola]|nr:hypothetical protein [Raoultella planticola]HDH7773633.1 hypothetical protein [Raoultella planticola]
MIRIAYAPGAYDLFHVGQRAAPNAEAAMPVRVAGGPPGEVTPPMWCDEVARKCSVPRERNAGTGHVSYKRLNLSRQNCVKHCLLKSARRLPFTAGVLVYFIFFPMDLHDD